MELYYATDINEDTIRLSEEESLHCIRILRNKLSDEIDITDGQGNFYKGRISKADPKKCEVQIIHHLKSHYKKTYRLHVAIAPTKNIDRLEFFVEKSIEIGIDEISFLKCERSERKDVKIERMQKIAIAAMKQSKKGFLPVINPIIPYKQFIENRREDCKNRFIASLIEGKKISVKEIPTNEKYLIIIGPEGDFSISEQKIALDFGFQSLSLGQTILRTETAGIFVTSAIATINLA